MALFARLFAIAFFCLAAAGPQALADAPPPPTQEKAAQVRDLPPEAVTNHVLTLGAEKIAFTARAGAIRLSDARSGAALADVGYVSFERAETKGEPRPIVFLFNGGPGASSAWLALGAVSPWRVRLAEPFTPSQPPVVIENAESWLPFADLVFVDPPGTGFGRTLGGEDNARHFYSVSGDVDGMATAIRKWLAIHNRRGAPVWLVGESYGGFRVAKLLEPLRAHENIGVRGALLLSPALDLSWLEDGRNLLKSAAFLPSFAAVERGAKDRADLADVEAYAAGDYIVDLLRGPRDAAALARMGERVAALTGLDRETVRRLGGRVDAHSFARERRRPRQEVLSAYDGARAGLDPQPFARGHGWDDPVLDALRPVFGAAMSRLIVETLGWPVGENRYYVLNEKVAHDWDFGQGGRAGAEAVGELREAMALDPKLKIVVAHGLTDLVTPYFATKLLLDQLPPLGDPARPRFLTLPGGHMFYTQEESRKALRDAARAMIEEYAPTPPASSPPQKP